MHSPSTSTTPKSRYRRSAAGVMAAAVALITIGAAPAMASASPASTTGSAPVANSDEYETLEDTVLEVPAPGVLANDHDPDGDAIGIWEWQRVTAEGGTVSIEGDGSFTYEPPSGFVGTDTWTYRIADDPGVVCTDWPSVCLPTDPELDQATVTITVHEEPSVGPPPEGPWDPAPGTGEPDPDEDETPDPGEPLDPGTDETQDPDADDVPDPDADDPPEADGDDTDESTGPENVTPRAPARSAVPDYTG